MDIIGFRYNTGVSFCVETKRDYKEVAYVWDSGYIDWRIDPEKYNKEELKGIYNCSKNHYQENVVARETKLKAILEKYPGIEQTRHEAFFEKYQEIKDFYNWHLLWRLKQELKDLEEHKTTCVIHY